MIELNDDIDDLGRDAAKNIHTKFDNKAWGKMETLLNEDDRKQDDPAIQGSSAAGIKGYKSCNGLSLFLIGFVAGAGLLLIAGRLQKKS